MGIYVFAGIAIQRGEPLHVSAEKLSMISSKERERCQGNFPSVNCKERIDTTRWCCAHRSRVAEVQQHFVSGINISIQ